MKKILDEGKMIEAWVEELNASFVVDPAFAKRQPAARAMLEDEAAARFLTVMQAVVVKGPRMDPYWGQSMAVLRQSLLSAEQYHMNVRKFIELDLQGLPYLMTAMRQKADVSSQLNRVGAFTRQQLVKLQDQKKGY
jgi:hypothetical protein